MVATLGYGEQLAAVRDRIFTLAQPQRHHVVLDLGRVYLQGALRRVPEGGVYACTIHHLIPGFTRASSGASELMRPIVLPATLTELPGVLAPGTRCAI